MKTQGAKSTPGIQLSSDEKDALFKNAREVQCESSLEKSRSQCSPASLHRDSTSSAVRKAMPSLDDPQHPTNSMLVAKKTKSNLSGNVMEEPLTQHVAIRIDDNVDEAIRQVESLVVDIDLDSSLNATTDGQQNDSCGFLSCSQSHSQHSL